MTIDKLRGRYYPKVSIERRVYAFVIDFVTVWLSSSFFGSWVARSAIFLVLWWILRVIISSKNQGQSLGHWLMNMRVIDPRFDRTPGILELTKREGVVGFVSILAMWGLEIGFNNGLSMILLLTPLLVDGGVALSDPEFYQALHDRLAGTLTISTKRGFSLDLRIKRLWLLVKRRLRKR